MKLNLIKFILYTFATISIISCNNNLFQSIGAQNISNSNGLLTIQSNDSTKTTIKEPNILISSGSFIIADGIESTTVAIYNNGSQDASNFKITSSTPNLNMIIPNNCTNVLHIGEICYITIIAPTNTTSGSGTINASYMKDGVQYTISDNFTYIPPSSIAYFSIAQNNFNNTSVGLSVTKTIVVTNNGGASLSNITLSYPKVSTLTVAYTSSGQCGYKNFNLAVGTSCNIVVTYKPTAVTSANNFLLTLNAKYSYFGNTQNLISTTNITYSAITASMSGNLSSSIENFIMNSKINTSIAQNITITNNGKTKSNILYVTPIDDTNLSDITTIPTTTCYNVALSTNATCNITLYYRPNSKTPPSGTGKILLTLSDGNKEIPFSYNVLR